MSSGPAIFFLISSGKSTKIQKKTVGSWVDCNCYCKRSKLESGNKARVTDGKTVYVENSDRKKSNKLIKNISVVNKAFGCQKGGSSEPINPPCLRACIV